MADHKMRSIQQGVFQRPLGQIYNPKSKSKYKYWITTIVAHTVCLLNMSAMFQFCDLLPMIQLSLASSKTFCPEAKAVLSSEAGVPQSWMCCQSY